MIVADKIIYLNPGETLEIRWMNDEDDPKNATFWRRQVRPPRDLLRLWPGRVAPADHNYTLDRSHEAWKED